VAEVVTVVRLDVLTVGLDVVSVVRLDAVTVSRLDVKEL